MLELIGWHFSTGRLGYGDDREIVIGETHEVSGPLELCARGLHASEQILDALGYAPGSILCRVRLHGEILRGEDKACATRRTYLTKIDATGILREFARKCALDVIHLWDAPNVVKQFLETGDYTLRAATWAAASDVAWDTARVVASDAAWAAAMAATSDAARAAARNAAAAAVRAVASDAAMDAARDAAMAAARDIQNKRLTEMVEMAIADRV